MTGVKVQSLTLTTNHSEKTSANHFSETNTKQLVEIKFIFVNSRGTCRVPVTGRYQAPVKIPTGFSTTSSKTNVS